MKDRHVLDELSAYIDGEAKDADRITRHLQHCESCARHRMELLKLGAHLRALPQPEESAAFAAHVMARVTEQEAVRPFWRLNLLIPTFAGIAVMLLITTLALYGLTLAPASPPGQTAQPPTTTWVDEEVVVLELAALIDSGADLSVVEEPALAEESTLAEEDPEAPVTMDEILTVMAAAAPELAPAEPEFGEEDLEEMISTLASDEVGTLEELLVEYMHEG
ncbi:MAG: hypothetical protein HYZ00_03370 [Candidatus Hydrogenedentes bacterium]|nr:hypothetical protein [Candidatus Hydrogenedentota bacterium]